MPFPTASVLNSAGTPITINTLPNAGQDVKANSLPVTVASDQTLVVSGTITANAGTGTMAVSAAALPLPTGASTSANQTALNALFPATLGQKAMVASLAVVIASDQSAVPASQSGTWNVGLTGSAAVSTINGVAQAYGTGVRGATVQRVTIATDDVVPASQSGTWNITNVSGTISLPTGAATSANQSTLNTNIGATTDAAAANGATGSALAYLRSIKDAATDTTTQSPVKVLTYTANSNYETVAASATAQAMGATGATGDYLNHVLIIPATTSPGAVSIKDGAGSAITIFTGGASSVTTLVPFAVPVGAKSGAGAWQITTGTNVSAIGFGSFT